jgi:hypothetical protein
MEKPKIIVIDDDKLHRENFKWNLINGLNYDVVDYRDLKTFKEDLISNRYNSIPRNNLLFILDLMLAQELDESASDAPVLDIKIKSDDDLKKYREDDLGLRVARDIRDGIYEVYGISKQSPIIFFTCRQNNNIILSIKELNAKYLAKPQPLDVIKNAIEDSSVK